jgi:hypothetical protein
MQNSGEKSWSGFYLSWDLRLGFRGVSSHRPMDMHPRRGMGMRMRRGITRRRRLAWGLGLVGGVVGEGEGWGMGSSTGLGPRGSSQGQ